MATLRTVPNIAGVDDVYERLLALHDGRTLEDSFRIAARLNLILLNHIGDRAVIEQAFGHAVSQAALTPAADAVTAPARQGDRR